MMRAARTVGLTLGLLSAGLLSTLPVSAALSPMLAAGSSVGVTLAATAKVATVGMPVTYTATAPESFPGTPLYQFWVEDPDGAWVDAQNYSASNTFTFTPPADGSYLVAVDVLNAQQLQAGDFAAAATTVPNALFVGSSLVVTPPAPPLVKGNTAVVSAAATNITGALYQFWVESPSGTWTGGTYSSAATDAIDLTQAGTYHVVAYAKMPDAPANGAGAIMSQASTLSVLAGPGSSVEYQGGAISATNPIHLEPNRPVAVSIVNVDAGGNAVPVIGTAPMYFTLPSLAGLEGTAQWQPAGGGPPITTVAIPPTQSRVTVWLVSNTAQTVTDLGSAQQELIVTVTYAPSGMTDVTVAGLPGGIGPVPVQFSSSGGSSTLPYVQTSSPAGIFALPGVISLEPNSAGIATFTVLTTSAASVTVTLTLPDGATASFTAIGT